MHQKHNEGLKKIFLTENPPKHKTKVLISFKDLWLKTIPTFKLSITMQSGLTKIICNFSISMIMFSLNEHDKLKNKTRHFTFCIYRGSLLLSP